MGTLRLGGYFISVGCVFNVFMVWASWIFISWFIVFRRFLFVICAWSVGSVFASCCGSICRRSICRVRRGCGFVVCV